MTNCVVCHQVVVFAQQAPIVFCCKRCFDDFQEHMDIEWRKTHHHSIPSPRLSDVAFPDSRDYPQKKTGMLGQ